MFKMMFNIVINKHHLVGTVLAPLTVHGFLLQSFKCFLWTQFDILHPLAWNKKSEAKKRRYDQWTIVHLLSVCPPSLPLNSSNHPSRHLRLSAVVCLLTPSAFPQATLMIFYLASLVEIKRGRELGTNGALRDGEKIVFLWERALQRQICPVEISLSVSDLVVKKNCWCSRGASLEDRCLPSRAWHSERIKITFICQTQSMWSWWGLHWGSSLGLCCYGEVRSWWRGLYT